MFVLLNADQRRKLIKYLLERESVQENFKETIGSVNGMKDIYDLSRPLTEVFEAGLYLCLENRSVIINEHKVNLTVKEFDLLALLIMHPKRVFTYEMILDLVWNEDYTFYSRKAVNNHVSNLRKKLKIAPDIPDYIKSVYGVGYKFEV